MVWLLIVGGSLLLRILSRGGHNWLAPWNCYIFAQIILLGVAYLKFDPLMDDFSLTTWIAVILSGVSFFGGCLIAVGAAKANKIYAINASFDQNFMLLVRQLLPVLMIIFVLGTMVSYRSAGGWPMRMNNPDEARLKFAWPGFAGVMLFQSIYALALSGMATLKYEKRALWKLFGVIGIILPVCVGVISGMRFYSFMIIATLIMFLDVYKPISLLKLAGAGVGVILLLAVVFLIRMGLFGFDTFRLAVQHPEYAKTICLPFYQYVANNFWNLDWLFRLNDRTREVFSTLGFQSFLGFAYPTHMTFPIDEAYRLGDTFASILKLKSLNTTSYQGVLFIDFGWLGLFVIPLILGYLSSLAFIRGRRGLSFYDALLHGVLGFSVLFSFFTWIPQQPSWSFGIIYLLTLGGLARHNAARKKLGSVDSIGSNSAMDKV